MPSRELVHLVLFGMACAGWTRSAAAQQPIEQERITLQLQSGLVATHGTEPEPVFTELIEHHGASWIRLVFDEVTLSGSRSRGNASYLKLTSLDDGAVQYLDTISLRQWGYTSAYFNGDAVLLEIWTSPDTGPNEVIITSAFAGPPTSRDIDGIGFTGLCDEIDHRDLSSDPRVARTLPSLCTAFIIDDCEHCFLTSGECNQLGNASTSVVQFNVPLSNGSCQTNGIRHPSPDHQYAVDPDSHQSSGFQGAGNTWGYFGVFPNSNTGLLPHEAQGQWFVADPAADTQTNAELVGYGKVFAPVSCEWDRVQKLGSGPVTSHSGTTLEFRIDATSGDSGAPIFAEGSDKVLAIQNYFACSLSPASSNRGTWIGHPDLLDAIANPLGVCTPPPGPLFTVQGGIPDTIPETGIDLVIEILAQGKVVLDPQTARVGYASSNGSNTLPMTVLGESLYLAELPGGMCSETVEYLFQIDSEEKIYSDPPTGAHTSLIGETFYAIADFDMETDPGWTVSGIASAGSWERAIPGNYGRSDPASDADGSGYAYVTGSAENEDLDGGPMSLTTSAFDLSTLDAPELIVSVYHVTNDPANDLLRIDVTQDDGLNWIELESISGTVEWEERRYQLLSTIDPGSSVRIRFTSNDAGSGSITESAIDAFRIGEVRCTPVCPADTNGDGILTPADFTAWVAAFHEGSPECDQNADNLCTPTDFTAWVANFNAGC